MEQYNGEVVLEGIECAKACLGGRYPPVGLGTDTGCPYITHYMWRGALFVLRRGALGTAKIAGIDGLTGSLTLGKSADLIVTAGNPLEDLEALRHVSMVTMCAASFSVIRKSGKMPDCERELDKIF